MGIKGKVSANLQTMFIVGLAIALIASFAVTTGARLGMVPLSVSLEGGAWQFTAKTNYLKVDGVTGTGSLTQISLDPDGVNGFAPKIVANLGFIRGSGDDPVTVGGYTVHTYIFDVVLKTAADQYGVWFSSDKADIEFAFTMVLQEGIFNNTPDAMIAEAWISDYKYGITANEMATWADVLAIFDGGGDPAKNVAPEVISGTQMGVSLVTGGDTKNAECKLTLDMRAGGVILFSNILGFWYASGVNVYNVYAKYEVTVELMVEIPDDGDGDGSDGNDGDGLPFINPIVVAIGVITDLMLPITDMLTRLGPWGMIVAVVVVAIVGYLLLKIFVLGRLKKANKVRKMVM